MVFESDALTVRKAKQTKVFWFIFSKKNRKKRFFLKEAAKTLVNCRVFADLC